MTLTVVAVGSLVALAFVFYFCGTPSRFQLRRVFKIAAFLDLAIDHAKRDNIIDKYGNLQVVARNSWFLTYRGFLEDDVRGIVTVMANKKGFRNGYVEFSPKTTTFWFKSLKG